MQLMYFPISDDVSVGFEIKKIYKSQTKYQLKFRSQHWISDTKNFENKIPLDYILTNFFIRIV
jgi:hypothetical protein